MNENMSKIKQRESNLELYRIIVMLLIVAHHYVVNSGQITLTGNTEFNILYPPMFVHAKSIH